jgi:hypothetical protein
MSLSRISSQSIADGTVVAADIANASVTSAKIADANVTTSKIAENAIETGKIADANVTTAKLATTLALDTISVNSYSSNHFALGDITGNVTLNVAFASYFSCNATGNINWTFETPTDNTKVRAIVLEMASGGLYTQTWPTSTRWPSGTAPTLVATTGNVDVLVFITDDSGTNWRGALSQSDSF